MPLRVGIVGYGFAAATFHVPLIISTPNVELVAISSRDPGKFRPSLGNVQACATPEELFARTDIDLVVIPTPNDTHYSLAHKALSAGKHVVVDKPFTLTVSEASDLIDCAARSRRVLSVFHNRRWDADFLTIKKILAAGQLGRIVHFEAHFDRYRPDVQERWREKAGLGSGLWYDLGSHLLDQAICLFGMPQAVLLDLAKHRAGARTDDWFHAILHYGELRVILHGSALVADLGPRFILHGTNGSFKKYGLDTQEDALKAGNIPGSEGFGRDPLPGLLTVKEDAGFAQERYQNATGNYSQYYAALRDAIVEGRPNPVPPLEALGVMRLIELGSKSFVNKTFESVGADDLK